MRFAPTLILAIEVLKNGKAAHLKTNRFSLQAGIKPP